MTFFNKEEDQVMDKNAYEEKMVTPKHPRGRGYCQFRGESNLPFGA